MNESSEFNSLTHLYTIECFSTFFSFFVRVSLGIDDNGWKKDWKKNENFMIKSSTLSHFISPISRITAQFTVNGSFFTLARYKCAPVLRVIYKAYKSLPFLTLSIWHSFYAWISLFFCWQIYVAMSSIEVTWKFFCFQNSIN